MPFIELQSVDSTNNYALAQVNAGLAYHGASFFTHEQVAGKGQRGKTWSSGKDSSLILSMVVDPRPLLLEQQFQLSACIALAVCEFFSKYAGDATKIKWPNDLYWHDRKAGGILIENLVGLPKPRNNEQRTRNKGQGEDTDLPGNSVWRTAVIGIGINLNQGSFPEDLRNPVSLKQITGKEFIAIDLARELCEVLNENFKRLIEDGFGPVYADYLERLYKKGEKVRLKKGNRSFEAVIKMVSPQGSLLVQHSIDEEFGFGEVEWIIEKSGSPGVGKSGSSDESSL